VTVADLESLFPSGPPAKLSVAYSALLAAVRHTSVDRDLVAALVGALTIVAGNHVHSVAVLDVAIAGLTQARDLAARITIIGRPEGLPS